MRSYLNKYIGNREPFFPLNLSLTHLLAFHNVLIQQRFFWKSDSTEAPLRRCANRQSWEGEEGGVSCWWAHYGCFCLSGRLWGDFHLTAESGLMGSAEQWDEEENPCADILPQHFPSPSLTDFLSLPSQSQIPWSKSRETIFIKLFWNELIWIFHCDGCSSGCISVSAACFPGKCILIETFFVFSFS